MGEIFQYLLNGLTIGGIYALVALGFYIMWEVSKAANFTHGDVYMAGAVVAVVLVGRGVPLLLAAAMAMLVAAALGALIERFLVRPFNTEPNAIGWMLTTIAVGTLESGATQSYGSFGRPLPSPLAATPIRFGGAGIYLQELLLPVAAIAVMFGLEAFYKRTTLGRAMRAVAFNRTAAGLMGINPDKMALIAFAMAAAIGALAGILIAPIVPALPTMGAVIGLKAFMVAIVAGIANARGVVVVGIAFGVIEKLIEGYISTGARDAIGFTLMILALLIFPQGIFGRRDVVESMSARLQFIAIVVLGFAFLYIFRETGPSNYQIGVLMRCMILMIVAIGLNILIGHAGLVSLGQAALYGLGSYVAAWLALRQGVPFIPAVLAAVAATALMGAVLAYPTVRVRGVYLAVITIAFGLVFENILKEWLSVTGGTQGLIGIPRGNVFGVSLTRPIYFWVVAGCLIFAFVVQYNIIHSHYGRAMRATAQSENAARALGISLSGTRTLAFVISAGFAGLAGGLYTFLNLFVNYETFTFFHSITFLLMVVLGGVGSLAGPILGTAILTYIAEILQDLKEWQIFAYGALLLLVMFVMPSGIIGTVSKVYGFLSTRSRGRESGVWPNRDVAIADILPPPTTDTDTALTAEGLTLRFGGLTAVDDVRIRVRPGTVHGLIGPNGAGKSSLLNLISGFYTPTSGAISFFGHDITGQASYALARRGIARTFQNTELFGQMTVEENVLAAFTPHYRNTLAETLLRLPRFGREERAFLAQARQLLHFVGLSDYASEQARNLPFGHQRRLEIARALALKPRLLLLDEPAAGLTHGEIEGLKGLIRLLADCGVTVILVEHHVDMVMSVSDHVAVLDYGRVIASGTAAEVQDNPAVVEAYFGSAARGSHQSAETKALQGAAE